MTEETTQRLPPFFHVPDQELRRGNRAGDLLHVATIASLHHLLGRSEVGVGRWEDEFKKREGEEEGMVIG